MTALPACHPLPPSPSFGFSLPPSFPNLLILMAMACAHGRDRTLLCLNRDYRDHGLASNTPEMRQSTICGVKK